MNSNNRAPGARRHLDAIRGPRTSRSNSETGSHAPRRWPTSLLMTPAESNIRFIDSGSANTGGNSEPYVSLSTHTAPSIRPFG